MGLPVFDSLLMDWSLQAAGRYLVASVPELEYPRSDPPATVEFIGALSEVLDDVDVFVTNGGFGGVQVALSHGVPFVVAGRHGQGRGQRSRELGRRRALAANRAASSRPGR